MVPIPDSRDLSEAERRLLEEWGEARGDYPRDRSIGEVFAEQVARAPDAVALIEDDIQLTYAELDSRASRLALQLRQLGAGPEVPVAIYLERSLEMVVATLAILKSGGAYVPLDPRYPLERVGLMLAVSQAKLVLTNRSLESRVAGCGQQVVLYDAVPEETSSSGEASEGPPLRGAAGGQAGPGGLACIFFTSGSTGTPKAVEVTHRGILRLVFGLEPMCLDSSQTMLHMSNASFDAATFEVWGALLHGSRLVLLRGDALDSRALGRVLRGHRITLMCLSASLFNVVIDEMPEILNGVCQIIVVGEALSVAHIRRAMALLPDTRLFNGYGPTEVTTFTCIYPIGPDLEEGCSSIPIGRPIGNTRVVVLDERSQLVPIGCAGELYAGGDGLARGYRNLPEQTAQRFAPDPTHLETRLLLYRTGDRVRWRPDGQLEYLGRMDRQLKWWGYRIEPGEIENMLLLHPGVGQAVVVVREDTPGKRRLTAYLVGNQARAGDLQAYLTRKLPVHMVPGSYAWLEALPLTPNGKLDREALPAPASPGFDGNTRDVERTVAAIWRAVLGLSELKRDQDFFALGGVSMQLVEMLARVSDSLEMSLPFSLLYRARTVADLAATIEALRQDGKTSGQPPAKGPLALLQAGTTQLPPLFCVHPVGGRTLCYLALARQLGERQTVYGLDYDEEAQERTPPPSFVDLARRYNRALREAQPRGPYHLCGWSLGGVVAFEMAQQLREAGETVAFLAQVDSQPPTAANRYEFALDPDWLAVSGRLRSRLYRWCRASSRRLAWVRSLTRTRVFIWLTRLMGGRGTSLAGSMLFYHNAKRQLAALADYHPQFYCGQITYFRARPLPGDSAEGPILGWQELCSLPLEVFQLDCDHHEMVSMPQVQQLASHMRECLARIWGTASL